MKKIVTIALLLLATSATIKAQSPFTLEEAMRYAVENNTDVAIQKETNASTKQDRVEAIASLFPSLSASSSIYNSYGRSIDPETNTYTTVGNISNSYNISSYLTLFSGLKNINTLKASKIKVEMGGHSMQQVEDATALNVMKLYFDAIYYSESVELMREQKAAAEQLLKLTQKQEGLGVKSQADVALIESQVASYDLMLTQQENLHSQSLLNLKESMNFPFEEQLTLAQQSREVKESITEENINLEANPEYLAAQSNVQLSKKSLKIARGSYLPTLGVGAGYNNYYYTSLAEGYNPTPFMQQIKTNYGYYVGASLSIPIFNNLSYRTAVTRSKHSLRKAELELHKTQLKVSKAAHEAILQRDNSYKEQVSASTKIEASLLAYHAVLQKYKLEVSSIIDLQTSANDLLKAKAEELRARLNYEIESRIVEYYGGKPLINK